MLAAIAALALAVPPVLPAADVRGMIRDARRIVGRSGDGVWPRWSRTALPVQLVTSAGETMFYDAPLPGWTAPRVIGRQGLGTWQRSAFDVFGAVEVEMLDRRKPGWRDVDRRAPFALGAQLDAAAR